MKKKTDLKTLPYGHFGSALIFMLFYLVSNKTKVIDNHDLHHAHEGCHPMKNLDEENIDAVLVSGVSGSVIARLDEIGIKVYRSAQRTIQENIDYFRNKGLTTFTPAYECRFHGHGCKD